MTASIEYDLTFTEQAEYLNIDKIVDFSATHPNEKHILKKLTGAGAQLITGPRGCGKTTLLLKSYVNSMAQRNSSFPVYVNFKHSLRLEPLYSESGKATYYFNAWLILKIYLGTFETIEKLGIKNPIDNFSKKELIDAIEDLELCNENNLFILKYEGFVTLKSLSDFLEETLFLTGQKRAILLLDDAGHAFSAQQQRDFFELFRKIRSKHICPKAAIYPGTTNLSPSFHVGHDAEEINVWLDPTDSSYLDFMTDLLRIRLKPDLFNALNEQQENIGLICFAAFGIPRAMLNVVRSLSDSSNDENYKFTKNEIRKHIRESYDNSFSIFVSLKSKMPSYSKFIEEGEQAYSEILEQLKVYNKGKNEKNQAVQIAIKRPIAKEFEKLLNFYQYAGLLRNSGSISKGEKGTFSLYTVNFSAIIDGNTLMGAQSINFSDYVTAFKARPHQAFPRLTVNKLLRDKSIEECFTLSLPACPACQHPRSNENAKFCENCGHQLSSKSIFEEIVKSDISELPITEHRASTIKSNTAIKTIKDILMDQDNTELRKTPQVGPIWAVRIKSYAEEFIA